MLGRSKAGTELREDIAEAWAAVTLRGTVGTGKALNNLERSLTPGERVMAVTVSNGKSSDGGVGIAVVTDRRLLLHHHHMGQRKQQETQLSQITEVGFSHNRGSLTNAGQIVVTVAGGRIVLRGIYQKEADRFVAELRSAIAATHQTQANRAAPSGLAAELEKLAGLRDVGALTNDEFETAKRRLLG